MGRVLDELLSAGGRLISPGVKGIADAGRAIRILNIDAVQVVVGVKGALSTKLLYRRGTGRTKTKKMP